MQKKVTPMLSQKLEAKKFHLINWGNGGWVRLFSKKPIRTVAELQAANLYTTEGNPKAVQWYAQNGFHAVPLSAERDSETAQAPDGIDQRRAEPARLRGRAAVLQGRPLHARLCAWVRWRPRP